MISLRYVVLALRFFSYERLTCLRAIIFICTVPHRELCGDLFVRQFEVLRKLFLVVR